MGAGREAPLFYRGLMGRLFFLSVFLFCFFIGYSAVTAGETAVLVEGPERRTGMAFWPVPMELTVWRARYELPVMGALQGAEVYYIPEALPLSDLPPVTRRERTADRVWQAVEVRGQEVWFSPPMADSDTSGVFLFLRCRPRVMDGRLFCQWADAVRRRFLYFAELPSSKHPAPFPALVGGDDVPGGLED